jgi:hypothetical protein
MVVQAVMDGQIGAEHVTVDELISAHHLLADAAIGQRMLEELQRSDITVFEHDWQWLIPN